MTADEIIPTPTVDELQRRDTRWCCCAEQRQERASKGPGLA